MDAPDGVSLSSLLREDPVVRSGFSDDELQLLAEYERRFLMALSVSEKLYCDICFRDNRDDGCRAQVTLNGLSAIARIACRCRIRERKGLVH